MKNKLIRIKQIQNMELLEFNVYTNMSTSGEPKFDIWIIVNGDSYQFRQIEMDDKDKENGDIETGGNILYKPLGEDAMFIRGYMKEDNEQYLSLVKDVFNTDYKELIRISIKNYKKLQERMKKYEDVCN